jgi:NAD/NADP transhydrogenase beta subunit
MIKNHKLTDTPDFVWIEKISKFLDSRFRIPGTNFTFGWDPLIGLIPGVGDFAGFIISSILMMYMTRYGASRKVVIMMSLNVLIDATFGSIPFIGSVFDFGFKANKRNIQLLKEHYYEGKHQGSGNGIIIILFLVMISFFALLIFSIVKVVSYIIHLF